MTATRTNANLLYEASLLDDNAYAYGALILARAIAHELTVDLGIIHAPDCPCGSRRHTKITAAWYGDLIHQAFPGKALAARRIVVTQDAAELAFAS